MMDDVSLRVLKRKRFLAFVLLDVFMLVELAFSVYLASMHHDAFTPVFLASFFGLLIPTFLLWRSRIRRLVSTPTRPGEQP